jgi:HK97 family phage major capsid protein
MNKEERITGGFKSLGDFLVAVRKFSWDQHKDSRLKTAGHMAEGDDAQGGFLVPETWAAEIYHAALEGAIVRPRATVIKSPTDSLKVRKLVETSRVSNLFGGVTFTLIAEAGDKVASTSKPALGELELTLHKLVGQMYVSNELEDDFGRFGDFMKLAFGQAIRFMEDDYFINGVGANQPLGILQAGCLISVPRQAVNNVNIVDLGNMARRLLPDSWNRAVWLVNAEVLKELFQIVGPAANVGAIINLSERTIFGLPIIVSEKCPALGTLGDVILADFGAGHYVIADREMRIAASRHTSYGGGTYGFATDETSWKIVLRFDGQPLMTAALTPRNGRNTLSPFVTLTDITS